MLIWVLPPFVNPICSLLKLAKLFTIVYRSGVTLDSRILIMMLTVVIGLISFKVGVSYDFASVLKQIILLMVH